MFYKKILSVSHLFSLFPNIRFTQYGFQNNERKWWKQCATLWTRQGFFHEVMLSLVLIEMDSDPSQKWKISSPRFQSSFHQGFWIALILISRSKCDQKSIEFLQVFFSPRFYLLENQIPLTLFFLVYFLVRRIQFLQIKKDPQIVENTMKKHY